MKIILVVVLGTYMLLNLLAIFGNKALRQSKWKVAAYLVASAALFAACVLLWQNRTVGAVLCIAGFLIYALCTVHNGYILHGKPNWRHHVIRFVASAVLCVLYILV